MRFNGASRCWVVFAVSRFRLKILVAARITISGATCDLLGFLLFCRLVFHSVCGRRSETGSRCARRFSMLDLFRFSFGYSDAAPATVDEAQFANATVSA